MIYLNNNATTLIAPEVEAAMERYNGKADAPAIETARAKVAELIGAAHDDEIIFTTGGTDANTKAILRALAAQPDKTHIVTTRVEHGSVRKLCEKLQTTGYEVTWLGVNEEGLLDLEELRAALRPDTALVSIMLANNETGILFPMLKIAAVVKETSSALFHVDGACAVGKIEVDLKDSGVDLFSFSAHKFHGPEGVGALYARRDIAVNVNDEIADVVKVIALGAAAELARDISEMERVAGMRDKFESELFHRIPIAFLNGTADPSFRLPNTSSISFEGMNGEVIMARLHDAFIEVSTGSVCNSKDHAQSLVLQAMDVPYERAMGSIRFSLSRYSTEGEVELVLEEIKKIAI